MKVSAQEPIGAPDQTTEALKAAGAPAEPIQNANPFFHDQRSAEGIRREMGTAEERKQSDPVEPTAGTAHRMTAKPEDETLLRLFVGKNFAKFLHKWSTRESESLSWNWAAFFFVVYWLLYRKMYLKAAQVFGGVLAISAVGGYLAFTQSYALGSLLIGGASLGAMVLCGVKGNTWYFQYCTEKLDAIKASSTPDFWQEIATAAGGTSWIAVIGFMLINALIGAIGGAVVGQALQYARSPTSETAQSDPAPAPQGSFRAETAKRLSSEYVKTGQGVDMFEKPVDFYVDKTSKQKQGAFIVIDTIAVYDTPHMGEFLNAQGLSVFEQVWIEEHSYRVNCDSGQVSVVRETYYRGDWHAIEREPTNKDTAIRDLSQVPTLKTLTRAQLCGAA